MIMSTVDLERHKITVTQAAARCGKTTGRIRQICREHEIGTLIAGRLRLLSNADLKRLEKIISITGRNFSNSEN